MVVCLILFNIGSCDSTFLDENFLLEETGLHAKDFLKAELYLLATLIIVLIILLVLVPICRMNLERYWLEYSVLNILVMFDLLISLRLCFHFFNVVKVILFGIFWQYMVAHLVEVAQVSSFLDDYAFLDVEKNFLVFLLQLILIMQVHCYIFLLGFVEPTPKDCAK